MAFITVNRFVLGNGTSTFQLQIQVQPQRTVSLNDLMFRRITCHLSQNSQIIMYLKYWQAKIIGLPYKNIQKQPLQFFADEIQRTISLLASIPLLAKASLLEIACCMYIRHWV